MELHFGMLTTVLISKIIVKIIQKGGNKKMLKHKFYKDLGERSLEYQNIFNRYKNMSLNIKRMILNRWIPLLVLVIVVQGTRVIFGTSIISGLLQIFLAIISYFIALYAIKDETLMEMIGK